LKAAWGMKKIGCRIWVMQGVNSELLAGAARGKELKRMKNLGLEDNDFFFETKIMNFELPVEAEEMN
jgi:hypothetical protein